MDTEVKKKRNKWWIAAKLKRQQRELSIYRAYGLGQGKTKRPPPKNKPLPPRSLRHLLDM